MYMISELAWNKTHSNVISYCTSLIFGMGTPFGCWNCYEQFVVFYPKFKQLKEPGNTILIAILTCHLEFESGVKLCKRRALTRPHFDSLFKCRRKLWDGDILYVCLCNVFLQNTFQEWMQLNIQYLKKGIESNVVLGMLMVHVEQIVPIVSADVKSFGVTSGQTVKYCKQYVKNYNINGFYTKQIDAPYDVLGSYWHLWRSKFISSEDIKL